MKAIWNGVIIAESNDTILIEDNHYFPATSLKMEYFVKSNTTSICPWKGTASYFTVVVNNNDNIDAAWYYPAPKEAAIEIKDFVAFWKGVEVTE